MKSDPERPLDVPGPGDVHPDVAAALGVLPSGPETDEPEVDQRVREAVVKGFVWTVGTAGVVWGILYLLLDAPGAAVYPFGFSILTALNALAYRATARFRAFAWVEILLILFTPFFLTLHLGGFAPSGAVFLWSSLAPLGAMFVLGRAQGALMFGAFVVAAFASVVVQGRIGSDVVLAPIVVEAFAFLNVVAVSGAAVVIVARFVGTSAQLERQQRQLRQLEQAYLSQELVMRQQERLATLGRLSAGVAHELNNPAAAAVRATQQLSGVIERIADHPARLLESGLDASALERVGTAVRGTPPDDPLTRSDRAESLGEWLESHDVDDAWELADHLVEAGIESHGLDAAAQSIDPHQLVAAARWIADATHSRHLVMDVRQCADRISKIVRALKGYSHMDRAGDHQPVDVTVGLDDTLIVLGSKVRDIAVNREYEPELPEVWGNAGELNQVWTNLIANAAEAGARAITLRAGRADRCVRVEVEDDGQGIPPDLIGRVFDPFVTTKAPGQGTGLGLNLAHRTITEGHHGSITVESAAGRTRFSVTLPVRQAAGSDVP